MENLEALVRDKRNRERVAKSYLKLRALRKSVCSAAAFARSVPTHAAYIHRVESGRTKGIGAETVQRILEAYELLEACDAGASETGGRGRAADVERPRRRKRGG